MNLELNRVYNEDCLEFMKRLPDNSIDSIVTDPPYGLSKQPDIYEVLKCWMNGEPFVHSKKGFMGACYHKDTDILTASGWKNIKLVDLDDIVLTLNPTNLQIENSKIVKLFDYDFNGKLKYFSHRSSQQCVTDNHNVFTIDRTYNGRLQRADSVKKNFGFYNQSKVIFEEEEKLINVNGYFLNGKYFCLLLGLFLGDGFCVTRKGSRRGKVRTDNFFGFHVKKERKAIKIREAFNGCQIIFNERFHNGNFYFECNDDTLIDYFYKLGKAYDKYIPREILNLSPYFLQFLFEGLIESDGNRTKGGQITYSTISQKLADDIQELCLKIGRSAIKINKIAKQTTINGRIVKNTKNSIVLSILQTNKIIQFDPRENNISYIEYKDKVYCINVEKNNIIYTRFNGKPVWSGNSWDSFVPGPEFFKEMFRIMKPGAHIACFAGSRTQDLMGIAIRMAGFEIKDTIFFLHSSGFPKNHNIPVNIDKKLGYTPKIVGQKQAGMGTGDSFGMRQTEGSNSEAERFAPVYEATSDEATSDEAKKWEGFGTALKPAYEPIILAKKPNEKGLSIAENVLKWGTGGINIKGCRVSPTGEKLRGGKSDGSSANKCHEGYDRPWKNDIEKQKEAKERSNSYQEIAEKEGRWPADIVHDGSDKILDIFAEFGETKSSKSSSLPKTGTNGSFLSNGGNFQTQAYGDEGSPSRMFNSLEYDEEDLDLMFYHCAKPSIADKDEGLEKYFVAKQKAGEYCLSTHNGESRLEKSMPRFNIHPTIKSTNLMRWLCKLVTPPNGLIYDPFSGSGSTGKAASIEGFVFIGTELDEEFCKIANARVDFGRTHKDLLLSKKGKPLIKNKKNKTNENEYF